MEDSFCLCMQERGSGTAGGTFLNLKVSRVHSSPEMAARVGGACHAGKNTPTGHRGLMCPELAVGHWEWRISCWSG